MEPILMFADDFEIYPVDQEREMYGRLGDRWNSAIIRKNELVGYEGEKKWVDLSTVGRTNTVYEGITFDRNDLHFNVDDGAKYDIYLEFGKLVDGEDTSIPTYDLYIFGLFLRVHPTNGIMIGRRPQLVLENRKTGEKLFPNAGYMTISLERVNGKWMVTVVIDNDIVLGPLFIDFSYFPNESCFIATNEVDLDNGNNVVLPSRITAMAFSYGVPRTKYLTRPTFITTNFEVETNQNWDGDFAGIKNNDPLSDTPYMSTEDGRLVLAEATNTKSSVYITTGNTVSPIKRTIINGRAYPIADEINPIKLDTRESSITITTDEQGIGSYHNGVWCNGKKPLVTGYDLCVSVLSGLYNNNSSSYRQFSDEWWEFNFKGRNYYFYGRGIVSSNEFNYNNGMVNATSAVSRGVIGGFDGYFENDPGKRNQICLRTIRGKRYLVRALRVSNSFSNPATTAIFSGAGRGIQLGVYGGDVDRFIAPLCIGRFSGYEPMTFKSFMGVPVLSSYSYPYLLVSNSGTQAGNGIYSTLVFRNNNEANGGTSISQVGGTHVHSYFVLEEVFDHEYTSHPAPVI